MTLGRFALLSTCLIATAAPSLAYTHARRGPTSPNKLTKHAPKPKFSGPRAIDDERATQIQNALIKAGYLTGTPSGHWDEPTTAAMTQLQADNGWQTKLVPDSRALIKIGLGPTTAYAADSAQASAAGPQSGNTFAQR
jgi:hypothetical protein